MSMFTHQRLWLLLLVMLAVGVRTVQAQPSQNYIGKGGKGISLTIYVPQSSGLAKEQSYIPALVQGEFVSNFSNYSAISILDWERLDDIYVKLVDEAYDDRAEAKLDVVLGRLAPTSHFLTGNITKTATGYNVKMNITATADKLTLATYSGTFSFAELDNLTGIRRASLELLQKVGVELTEKARKELVWAAEANQVLAQTALAKGVTAQRAGTEVAALSYYIQAASFNPSLKEAVKRSTIVAADISSGNLGADLRNDILWRKKWVERLKETEEAVNGMITMIMNNAVDPPYTLVYFTDIKTGNIDYQTETADLSISMAMNSNRWFTAMRQTLNAAAQATQAVLDGLNATKRKEEWKLSEWPRNGVSYVNPFAKASMKGYDLAVVFELVNQQGRVIGSQTVELKPAFNIEYNDNGRFTVGIKGDAVGTVTFEGVKANDISDNLTIRVASVNGAPPQQARLAIVAKAMLVEKSQPFTDNRNGKKYNTVCIGGKTWMAENMNYQPQTGQSWCYGQNNSNCNKYGRLYDWETAMNVCPIGWRLPSSQEWDNLETAAGGNSVAGKKLMARNGWDNNGNGTDDYGFSALPGGYRLYKNGSFYRIGEIGFWWTATENGSDKAYTRDMYYKYDFVGEGHDNKSGGYSVRCLED